MTPAAVAGARWKLGLAVLAMTAALAFLVFRARDVLVSPPSGLASSPASRLDRHPAPRPEGPAMRIDPARLAEAGRARDDNALGMEFRWCPPGSFPMGRLPETYRRFEEVAPVEVTFRDGFWMGRHEVTQSQWLRVMGLTLREQRALDPSQPRPVGDGSSRDHVGEGPDHPIYFTSYGDAEEFCRRLTEGERKAGRLEDGWEYRLPDEAQWEYACRAGADTATAFGDRLDGTRANFDGTKPFGVAPDPEGPYLRETTPVSRYPANAWGLHDMHGNVWEWCRDLPFERSSPTQAARGTTPSEGQRTYRGGCWHNPGSMCLSTSRARAPADTRGSGLGFRVALIAAGSRGERVP